MSCKKCGKNVPVLKSTSKSGADRFIGMCKPCIKKEMREMRGEVRDKVSDFLKGMFS